MGERCGDKLEVNLVEATGKIKGRPSEANHSVSLFLSSMHGCPKIMANLYIFYFDWASPDRIGLYFCAPHIWCNSNAPSLPGATNNQQQRTVITWCKHRECLSGKKAAHLTQLASVFYFVYKGAAKYQVTYMNL